MCLINSHGYFVVEKQVSNGRIYDFRYRKYLIYYYQYNVRIVISETITYIIQLYIRDFHKITGFTSSEKDQGAAHNPFQTKQIRFVKLKFVIDFTCYRF